MARFCKIFSGIGYISGYNGWAYKNPLYPQRKHSLEAFLSAAAAQSTNSMEIQGNNSIRISNFPEQTSQSYEYWPTVGTVENHSNENRLNFAYQDTVELNPSHSDGLNFVDLARVQPNLSHTDGLNFACQNRNELYPSNPNGLNYIDLARLKPNPSNTVGLNFVDSSKKRLITYANRRNLKVCAKEKNVPQNPHGLNFIESAKNSNHLSRNSLNLIDSPKANFKPINPAFTEYSGYSTPEYRNSDSCGLDNLFATSSSQTLTDEYFH